ncbi:EAL domain-containing protein [Paenibacillus sp. GYB003]|uniref:EAL domain-containing protein n=1 Tax=Paenibacillus sp. GYB003 TaxID=2994392 RepID=UPI002F9622CB
MHIIEKHKRSEFGVQVGVAPVVNRDFQLVAYEVIMQFDTTNQEQISEHALDRYIASKTHKESVPLILNSQSTATSHCLNLLADSKSEIILQVEFSQLQSYARIQHQSERSSGNGVQIVLSGFIQCYFSLPILIDLRPKFIKLAWEVIQSCADDDTMHGIAKLLKPLKESGTLVIVDGIEDRNRFERVEPFADAFQGCWITQNRQRLELHSKL